MQHEVMLLWWWLQILTRRRYELLKEQWGDLEKAWVHFSPALLKELGLKDQTIAGVFARLEAFDRKRYLFELARRKVELLCIEDERYPAALRDTPDAPVFLSAIGDLSVLQQPLLGIVGTRLMSPYGHRIVQNFVPVFAQSGIVTVSGLALGIDAAVARETMGAGGRTVAVLGSGLAKVGPPENIPLAEEITARGGLLLSEYPLEVRSTLYTFPARNRIIAGVSRGTLVCEAPEDSGSIITAELALSYGRPLFAAPGQIFDASFTGCHRLLANGQAHLAFRPEDVLRGIGMAAPERESISFVPRSDDEEAVYGILTALPQTVDDLAERTNLPASRIGVALTMMELSGAVKNLGEGQWVKC